MILMRKNKRAPIYIFLLIAIATIYVNGCSVKHYHVPDTSSQSMSRVHTPTLIDIARSTYGFSLSVEGAILFEQVGNGNKAIFEKDCNNLDACYIQFLCHPTIAHLIPPRGISIEGASIKGELDLTGFDVDFPIWIKNSTFDDRIQIQSTKLRGLYMYGNRIASIRTVDVEINKSLQIRNNCIVEGSADFNHIMIMGDFDCRESHFLEANSVSLNLFGSHIYGDVYLGADFSVASGISLSNSRIDGSLILYDGKNQFINGTFNLNGTRIGGDLYIEGVEYLNATDEAMNAQGLIVEGRFLLHDVNSIGEIDLRNATIHGNLSCRGNSMHGSHGSSLVLSDGHFKSGVSIDSTVINGTVSFQGANVGKELIFNKVTFHNRIGDAIFAQGLQVGGRLLLHDVNSIGEIDLMNATVHGDLDCQNSNMQCPSGSSLNLSHGRFESSVFVASTEMHGTVNLLGANVGSELTFQNVRFHNRTEDALFAQGLKVGGRLLLHDVNSIGEIDLSNATVQGNLSVHDSNCSSIQLGHGHFESSIFVTSTEMQGIITLLGANVESELFFKKVTFRNREEQSLFAQGLRIGGRFLLHNVISDSMIDLNNAIANGIVDFNDCVLSSNNMVLVLENTQLKSGITFRSTNLNGKLSLVNSVLGGDFDCRDSSFSDPNHGVLNCAGIRINGRCFLGENSKFEGIVNFEGASISSDCFLRKSNFENVDGFALHGPGLKIGGRLQLIESRFLGIVQLAGSPIKQEIIIKGCTIDSNKDTAFNYKNLRAEAGMQICDSNIIGGLLLEGSVVGGDLQLIKSRITKLNEYSVNATRSVVNGNLIISNGVTSEGNVLLGSSDIGCDFRLGNEGEKTRINGNIEANNTKIGKDILFGQNCEIDGKINFNASNIGRILGLAEIKHVQYSSLDLSFAKTHILDDSNQSWPDKDNLLLDGFEYERLSANAPNDVDFRLEWLSLQHAVQPYEQLAKYYRNQGRDDDANKIIIAKNQRFHKRYRLGKHTQIISLGYRLKDFVLEKIDYGYNPWNLMYPGPRIGHIFLCIPAWIGVGIFLSFLAYRYNILLPRGEMEYISGTGSCGRISQKYPRFSCIIYSLDTFIPLMNFHQAEFWLPGYRRDTLRGQIPRSLCSAIFRLYLCFHTFFGWFLTTLLVVALTGLIKT